MLLAYPLDAYVLILFRFLLLTRPRCVWSLIKVWFVKRGVLVGVCEQGPAAVLVFKMREALGHEDRLAPKMHFKLLCVGLMCLDFTVAAVAAVVPHVVIIPPYFNVHAYFSPVVQKVFWAGDVEGIDG